MSRVPGVEAAVVDEHKITDYLLSIKHPTGRFKAQFFMSFGFRPEAWEVLRDALLSHIRDNDVTDSTVTQFGTKYRIDGALTAPDGRRPRVRTVWFAEQTGGSLRFVTAHPI